MVLRGFLILKSTYILKPLLPNIRKIDAQVTTGIVVYLNNFLENYFLISLEAFYLYVPFIC